MNIIFSKRESGRGRARVNGPRKLAGAVVAAVLALTACSSSSGGATSAGSSDGSIRVVASTNVYGDIVRQIGGDQVRVTSIIADPTQDPHSYEANTKNQLELSKAQLVIENGGGYDDFVDSMLKTAKNSEVTVLNAVDISGHKAPAGGELNEHVWYDFAAMKSLVAKITAALSAADATHAATFTANAATFDRKLSALQATEAQIKAQHAGAGAAITEPVPLYLLQSCGLVNRTPTKFSEAIEAGTDVPASVLKDTLKLFSSKSVKLLAYNSQTAGPETEKVLAAAKSAGVAVVPVTETLPAGQSYLSWMSANVTAVQSALDAK